MYYYSNIKYKRPHKSEVTLIFCPERNFMKTIFSLALIFLSISEINSVAQAEGSTYWQVSGQKAVLMCRPQGQQPQNGQGPRPDYPCPRPAQPAPVFVVPVHKIAVFCTVEANCVSSLELDSSVPTKISYTKSGDSISVATAKAWSEAQSWCESDSAFEFQFVSLRCEQQVQY
jgi:hypothetical protein